jgi:hypothetical protein
MKEDLGFMDKFYLLSIGKYFIGDPSLVIQKKGVAIKFINRLWDLVYVDKQTFKKIEIEGIKIYILKIKSGDGVYDGIGTDSGVISIIDIKDMKDSSLFHIPQVEKGFKWLTLDKETKVEEINGILNFDHGFQVNTNDH